MSVQFDEEVGMSSRRAASSQPSMLTRLVLKLKLAKTEKSAQYILAAVGVISILAAIFIFLDLGNLALSSAPSVVSPGS